MLPKRHRVSHTASSQIVRKKSKSITGTFFSLRVYDAKENSPRFVIVVSKKVAKKASQRNMLKRQIRSILADVCKKNNFGKRGVYFIYTKKSALSASYKDIQSDILNLLDNI